MHIRRINTKTKGVRLEVFERDPQGKQYKKRFAAGEEKEARLWAAEIAAGRHQYPAVAEDPTFQELATQWWELHAEHALQVSSQYTIACVLDHHLMPTFADKVCGDISPLDMQRWRAKIGASEFADSTVSRACILIKQIFRWGVQHGLIVNDPTIAIKSPKMRRSSQKQWDYWLHDEVERFLDANRGYKGWEIWMIALNTGLRRGEMIALEHHQVDIERNQIFVCQHWCPVEKRILPDTKSGQCRYVTIPPMLRPVLLQLLQKPGPRLLTQHSGKPVSYAVLYKWFREAIERSGVKRIRPHDMRHTFASHHMMAGGDLYDLKELLGHSSITQTEQYAHLSPTHLQDVSVVNFGGRVLRVVEAG